MDIRTLMAARLYVRDTANALGAVKGSPCTITSITEADDGIHIAFSWTGTDGTVATQTAIMPYVAVDKVAREAVETLREDMDAAIDTTVRSINGRTPDSAGNVALPLAVTGVPNTGSPNQVYVTDSEGKPGWEDRTHYDATEYTAVAENRSAVFANDGAYVTYYDLVGFNSSDEAWRVVWDGVTYDCITYGGGTLGNHAIRGIGDNTGEPFLITTGSMGARNVYAATAGDHTFSFYRMESKVVPLDDKYLPSTIQRTNDTVVIPSGKSLTLEAGATVNDPDGVLGGGGAVSWNDLTDKPFGDFTMWNTSFENATFETGTSMGQGWYYYDVDSGESWSGFEYADYKLVFNGEEYYAHANGSETRLVFGSLQVKADGAGKYRVMNPNGDGAAVISLYQGEVKRISTVYIKTAEAVADAAGDTPTAAEFNALLSSLRAAGLLST